MLKYIIAAGMLILGGCADLQTARSVGGRQISECAVYRTPGPCYDGTDITDRTNRDTIRDITEHVSDDTRDNTDRTIRDDTTDRTVWCEAVQQVIRAPSFMVFFDWDKSNLTPLARDTIRKAADAYKAKGGARVRSTGHTDTSGPADYNMALSYRRANAVKDELVRDGVSPEDISVVGRGETQLLVPTPDGVREAQNRRVEIVIQ